MHAHLFAGGVRSVWNKNLTHGVLAAVLIALTYPAVGQMVDVGGIARNFTVTERRTGQPIHLYDYAGSVVVLDFFAYWCGPCQVSSPDLRANVDDYYRARGGNAHGVPVVVLSVNIESQNPPATDAFISGFRLGLVADDFDGDAYNQFGDGFIPLFVIINGVDDLPAQSYDQWEVLFRDSGYPGAGRLRTIIDSVNPANPTGPATVRIAPVSLVGRAGVPVVFNMAVNGLPPISYQWFKNDVAIKNANTNRLAIIPLAVKDRGSYKVKVSNALGSQTSVPVGLMVYDPGVNSLFVSTDVPKAIPDYPEPGAESVINVEEDWEVIRLAVQANLSHSYVGDLYVSLTSPSGKTLTLREATGASGSQLSISLPDVRSFMGHHARGTWTLRALDLYAQDVGTINSWSLNIEHAPPGTSYQEWAAGYPHLDLTDASGDSDGDNVSNFVEFLIDGFSPEATDRLPTLSVDPADNAYVQLTVPLRPNIERAVLAVQLASSLAANAWAEAVTSGDNVIVDQSVPNTLKVRLKRSVGTTFLRLIGVQL
jgi:subtilisin-like proprotein convertase family protein/thiol-disulfide isomerase/thioredoxin